MTTDQMALISADPQVMHGQAAIAAAYGAALAREELLPLPQSRWSLPSDGGLFACSGSSSPPKSKPKASKPKTGYASTHGTGTKSDPSKRCGAMTKSGPCRGPFNHPHGHMSEAVKNKKTEAQKAAEKAAKSRAAAA